MIASIFEIATGKILRVVSAPENIIALQFGDGEAMIEGDIDDSLFYIENGEAVRMPDRPNSYSVFDYSLKQWIDPRALDDAKAAKRDKITQRRVGEDLRFEWAGKWFQADLATWKQISGVHGWVSAQGSLPPGFPNQWKAEDNTYAAINSVADWWSFYGAVVARGSTNFLHSEVLKAQVNAAQTVAEVDAVPVW